MLRQSLNISILALSLALGSAGASPALAQTSGTTIVRQAVPQYQKVIVANSAEDIALKEEIRRINAYNAYLNTQIGVSDSTTTVQNANRLAKIQMFEQARPATILQPTPIVRAQTRNIRTLSYDLGPYVVQQGDTLYGLSRKSCVSVAEIQKTNNLSSTAIQLGQKLIIPAERCLVANAPTHLLNREKPNNIRRVLSVPTSITSRSSLNYAVLPKDTLYGIGARYCITALKLAQFNDIGVGATLQPGQILKVPQIACKQ
jgi:LysM repeat protein